MTEVEKSEYYFKFMNEGESRLDYVFHHPRYDEIKRKVKSKTFIDLNEVVVPDSMHQGYGAVGKETGKIPYINIENLDFSGFVKGDEIKYIDEAPDNRFLQVDDMLISRSREIGKCCVVTNEFASTVCGSYIFFFRIKKEKILPLFLAKYINSELGQLQVEYIQTGSSGNNINIDEAKTIRIPDVSKDHQQKVLDLIKPLEDEADRLELKVSQGLKERDQLLFDELGLIIPPETNFSYFYSTPSSDERLSFGIHHPDNKALEKAFNEARYNPRPLSDFLVLHEDSIETSKSAPSSVFTYIGLDDIGRGTGKLLGTKKLLGKDIFSKSAYFRKGQLMYSRLRPYLNKAFLLENLDEAIGSSELFVCSEKDNALLPLVKYYLLSEATLRQIKWILSGSSYPRLDEADFLKIKVVLPEQQEKQNEILIKIENYDSTITALKQEAERKRSEAQSLFKSMLFDKSSSSN